MNATMIYMIDDEEELEEFTLPKIIPDTSSGMDITLPNLLLYRTHLYSNSGK